MDFSVAGSDVWESTPTQDLFIESYFHHNEEPLAGKSKKRKMIVPETVENQKKNHKPESTKESQIRDDQSHPLKKKTRKRKKKGKKVVDHEESEFSECPKKYQISEESISKFSEVSKISDMKSACKEKLETKSALLEEGLHYNSLSMNLKSGQKFPDSKSLPALNPKSYPPKPKQLKLHKKTQLKSSKYLECRSEDSMSSPTKKSKLSQETKLESSTHPECTIEEFLPSATGKLKLNKKAKLKSSRHLECPIEESLPSTTEKLKLSKKSKLKSSKHHECPIEKPVPSPTKKLKKKTLRSDVQLEKFSEDESDDEKIIEDIKNSSIFKEIQKLMKEAPHLQNLSDSNLSDSDDSKEEIPGSCSDSDTTSKSNLIENHTISPTPVKLDPRPVKSCDFPRTLLEIPSADSMKSNLGKNKEKLQGAKFRHLNEKLYTESGEKAFKYFQENQEEYHDYHKGYNVQVSKWPMNPVDKILSDLENIEEGAVIADMGCGDAKIARTLTNSTVHSFDIVALNDHVTSCNISKVPLAKESVDVVVFCLSLMGTNLKEYLLEAHRILRMGGTLKIAEVESRMEDVNVFIKKLKTLGFSLKKKDLKHRMFVFLDFQKVTKKIKKDKIPSLALKPCLYKKR